MKLNTEKDIVKQKIRAFDPFVANVLTEYCEQLAVKNDRKLNIAESLLLKSIELGCSDQELIEKRELEGVIVSAKRILEGTPEKEWTSDHKQLFLLLKKLVFVDLEDESGDTDQINEVVDAMMRLDYSKETPVFKVVSEEKNIYNYIGLVLESISEKMRESTVSSKAINEYLSAEASKVLVVIDAEFKIRFISKSGEKCLALPAAELIDRNLKEFMPELGKRQIAELDGLNTSSDQESWEFGVSEGESQDAFVAIRSVQADEFNGEEDEVAEYIVTIDLNTNVRDNDEEIYNSLTAIDGVIEAIKSLKKGDVSPSDHNYRLQTSLESLYRLKYNQLDKLNDVESASEEFIDPTTLVKSVLSELRFQQGYDKISFSIQNKRRKPFFGDCETIYSIVKHLISNAVKYRKPEADDSMVEINFSERGSSTVIDVIDNGIGIKEDQLEHIFKKGYRIESDVDGYGLGLYFVRRCLLRCKGSLSVESTVGQGTKFQVILSK